MLVYNKRNNCKTIQDLNNIDMHFEATRRREVIEMKVCSNS